MSDLDIPEAVRLEAEYYGIDPEIWVDAIADYPDVDRGELAQELARALEENP